MSMHGHVPKEDCDLEDEDAWIEAEIERELNALDSADLDKGFENVEVPPPDNIDDSSDGEEQDEMSSEMQDYVQHMRAQTDRLEKELEECDQLLQETHNIVSTPRPDQQDLMDLAQERGEDLFTMKRKVLAELEREDEVDERLKLESVNEDELEVNVQLKADPKVAAEHDMEEEDVQGDGDAPVEDIGPSTFLTALEEKKQTEEEEYQELRKKILGETDGEQTAEADEEREDQEEDEQEGILPPEEGIVMAAIDPAALEQKILREVLDWEDKWLEKNQRRQEEVRRWTEEETMKMEEEAAKRKEKIRGVQQQQEDNQRQQENEQEKILKESEEVQQEIKESLNKYQVEFEEIAQSVRQESEALEHAKEAKLRNDEDKRQKAATKIQACYRGYRVYKEEGRKVQDHIDSWREQKTQARIAALEESRKKKAEEKKRIEEEEKRRQEYILNKEMEKKRLEEDRKLKAEEDKKKEEEEKQRKMKEEEQRKLEEEKRREEKKRLEEEKKKEQERKKKEEEEKRLEEARMKEEKKRKMVEEQMKAAEEKRLKEEQKKQEEERLQEEKRKRDEKRKKDAEEKRGKEEERKLQEDEKQKMSEHVHKNEAPEREGKDVEQIKKKEEVIQESKQTEEEKMKMLGLEKMHSPVPPEGKPKTPRKKVNELRKSSMSPLANGSRSPSLDADNELSTSRAAPVRDSVVRHSVRASQSDGVRASTTDMTPQSARSEVSMLLPERIEQQRLEWMKKCLPWSKTAQDLKSKKHNTNRRPLRRPISAKNLSPLSEATVVQAAGVTSLQQVTTVELHDLPGCSLKLLGHCPRLRALRINNSNIVSTEGIETCKELTYLDLKHNALEAVTLRDHQKLMYVDLSNNSLTSLLGMEGCGALRHLNASHNRITRISGVEGLPCLHTFDMSHNQLITTRGLSAAPTVQYLNLSHNHLPSIEDIDTLALLQVLQASGNNILQPPLLKNHVLLQTLLLDDNSLCSVRNLSLSWLPLLRHLHLAQNSLSSIDDLSNCVTLQNLDVSNNQILDVESLAKGLAQCCHLQVLKTDGNPVTEESDFKSGLLKSLPRLQKLDNKKVTSTRSQDAITEFENMCIEQIAVCDKIDGDFKRKLSKVRDLGQATSVHLHHYKQSHQVAVDHRYKHEYGDSSTDSQPDIDIDLDGPNTDTTNDQPELDVSEMKNKFELALQNSNASSPKLAPTPRKESSRGEKPVTQKKKAKIADNSISKKSPHSKHTGSPIEHVAAVRIQALWRGYSIRRDIDQHSRWWLAATTIQAAWRGHFVRKILEEMGYGLKARRAERHAAATKIQALWRGYRLRKRIEYALNYAKTFDDTDDIDDEMNFKEVDLSAFDFDVDDLEKGWTPPETPQIPANHAALGNLPSTYGQQTMSAKAAFDAMVERPPHPPNQPRQAWRNFDSPVGDLPYGSARRPPLPPVSRMSDLSGTGTENTGSTTQRTHRSRKEELSEEWGFKDTRTAELMMKRAKKLQYNSQRKKKLSQLDPKQRLALFRKLEETTKHQPVQPPPKKVLPRKEYFQGHWGHVVLERRSHSLPDMSRPAREEAVREHGVEKQRERADTNQRCFEWIHTQVGSYDVGTSRINQRLNDAAIYNNENLPQMDPNVIAGARPTLTRKDSRGSPMSLELQSLDSVSTAGDLQRRHSSAGDPASRLPPIKVSSAPAAQSRVDRPERMSFRNPKLKTMESVGWGGGKKRSIRR